jgi:hypothetical protein
MMRTAIRFCSTLAVGVFAAASIFALMPWLSGRLPTGTKMGFNGLQFESLLLGLMSGLAISHIARYNWTDIPRRIVTWVLVRERMFFYYALIAICVAVVLFY